MPAKIFILIVSVLFALGLSACTEKAEPVAGEVALADDVVQSKPVTIAMEDTASLLDTYWKLLALEGQPVTTAENAREAHIILAADESRAHGFSGCNNFFGGFKHDDESLSFSAMGSTMMACPDGMDTEQVFFAVLAKTTRYRISGQFLQIYADEQALARFEAVQLEKPADG